MKPVQEGSELHLLNPIPVWKRKITEEEVGNVEEFNSKLIEISKEHYSNWETEVPDERHLDKSGISEEYIDTLNNRDVFSHTQKPAVGKWHAVPTNNFLDLDVPEVKKLKEIILEDYSNALTNFASLGYDLQYNLNEINNSKLQLDESWMQYYKDGDYKVLHNHLRYEKDDIFKHIWAGGYYINDGKPDKWQPYSGRFEFNIKNNRYFVKPESGMIMLWPGDVLHAVNPFYGEEERICINFNLSTRIQTKRNLI